MLPRIKLKAVAKCFLAANLIMLANAHESHTDAIVIMQDGELVGSWYANGRERHYGSMSTAKSIVSLAIGRLFTLGLIDSLDVPMYTSSAWLLRDYRLDVAARCHRWAADRCTSACTGHIHLQLVIHTPVYIVLLMHGRKQVEVVLKFVDLDWCILEEMPNGKQLKKLNPI